MEEAQRQATLAIRRVLEGTTLPVALAAVVPAGTRGRRRTGRRRARCRVAMARCGMGHPRRSPEAAAKRSRSRARRARRGRARQTHTRATPFAIVDHAGRRGRIARPARVARQRADAAHLRGENAPGGGAPPIGRACRSARWIDRVRAAYPATGSVLAAGNDDRRWRCAERAHDHARRVPRGLRRAAGRRGGRGQRSDRDRSDRSPNCKGIARAGLRSGPRSPARRRAAGRGGTAGARACAAPVKTGIWPSSRGWGSRAALSDTARSRGCARKRTPALASAKCAWRRARRPPAGWDGRTLDRILVDVPCTPRPRFRRHRPTAMAAAGRRVAGFRAQQARILDALGLPCTGGGSSRCHVFGVSPENDEQIDPFRARHAEALHESLTFPAAVVRQGGQLLPSLPGAAHNQDGFFYALLRKA